jgi:acetyltransferase-like isoleucine patch superfamily enzyme
MYVALKNLIRNFLNEVRLKKLRKCASIGNNILINRNTKIISENPADIIIEDNVMMYGSIVSSNNGKIIIGKNSSIREGCRIFCANEIIINNNVIFADNVIVSDTNHHPVSPYDRLVMMSSGWSSELWKWKFAKSSPIKIESNVWLGQYSRILKGVTIGENSIVASNSVVTKNVPKNCIVAGNPAIIVKRDIHLMDREFK